MGRRIALAAAVVMGRKARKYIAPILPAVVTPVALGAAVSAGALVFFRNLADDIRSQEGVWRFDHDGLNFAEASRTPGRTALMRVVSHMARPDVMSGLGLVSVLIGLRSRRWRNEGILMAVTITGGGAIIGAIKYRYARERPRLIDALVEEETFSFPSGHAFISLCFYGTLAYWWMKTRRRVWERALIGVGAVHGIGLIGASRVYLGVHYPSDVLAGYAAAIPWLTACLTAYERYERKVHLLPSEKRPC